MKHPYKDVNDINMKKLGFRRHLEFDNPDFNSVASGISYWINDDKIQIITDKKFKLSIPEIITKIVDNAAYQTRRRVETLIGNSLYNYHKFVPRNLNERA